MNRPKSIITAETFAKNCQDSGQAEKLADQTYAYAQKGDCLPHVEGKTNPKEESQALETGFFKLAPVTQGNKTVGHRWIHFGDTETFTKLMYCELKGLPQKKLELEWIGVMGTRALRQINKEKRQQRSHPTLH